MDWDDSHMNWSQLLEEPLKNSERLFLKGAFKTGGLKERAIKPFWQARVPGWNGDEGLLIEE